jgi:hypothetical protein
MNRRPFFVIAGLVELPTQPSAGRRMVTDGSPVPAAPADLA